MYDINADPEGFTSLFQSIDAPFECQVYELSNSNFPESAKTCDAFLVAGSIKGVYDTDPWISELFDFIKRCFQAGTKLIGICFGHQAIAQALGGYASKSEKGWGLGLKEFNIIKHRPWMEPELKSCKLYFTHQDQVKRLPHGAELLGTNDFCPINIYCIGDKVLGLQGHPEYSFKMIHKTIEELKDQIPEDIQTTAFDSINGVEPDSKIVAKWIVNFICSGQ